VVTVISFSESTATEIWTVIVDEEATVPEVTEVVSARVQASEILTGRAADVETESANVKTTTRTAKNGKSKMTPSRTMNSGFACGCTPPNRNTVSGGRKYLHERCRYGSARARGGVCVDT
jgi:uncharacterized protein YfcZ (UPF0381/DUF406 family)